VRILIGPSKVPTNSHWPWLTACLWERRINRAGVKKPRHFLVHNVRPPLSRSISTPSPHFPLSPPVKTPCVISRIADNASLANATLFVQPLWTKFTRKASAVCSHYWNKTYYSSLKTDLFTKKNPFSPAVTGVISAVELELPGLRICHIFSVTQFMYR